MKRIMEALTIALCLLLIPSATVLATDINKGGKDSGAGTPPNVKFATPPEVVAIPGRYVYFVSDIDFDLFFFQGQWYRPYKGRWFRAENYAGPWEYVHEVPPSLIDLPPDYRTIPPGYSRIPYDELRNNWKRWEREKYFDKKGEDTRIRERERERDEREIHPERY